MVDRRRLQILGSYVNIFKRRIEYSTDCERIEEPAKQKKKMSTPFGLSVHLCWWKRLGIRTKRQDRNHSANLVEINVNSEDKEVAMDLWLQSDSHGHLASALESWYALLVWVWKLTSRSTTRQWIMSSQRDSSIRTLMFEAGEPWHIPIVRFLLLGFLRFLESLTQQMIAMFTCEMERQWRRLSLSAI